MKLFGSIKELVDVVFRRGSIEVTLAAKDSPSAVSDVEFELPDATAGSHELADLDTAQTLSSKTHTDPILNGSLTGTSIQDDDTFASPGS